MITDLKFTLDIVDPYITEENFPVQPEDYSKGRKFANFCPRKFIPAELAVQLVHDSGYQLSTLRGVLLWGANHWNGVDWVVALGSQILHPKYGRVVVPVLGKHGPERGLRLCPLDVTFDDGCVFLGTRLKNPSAAKTVTVGAISDRS